MATNDDRTNSGEDKPRANRGRQSSTDSLRNSELKSALSEFGAAYTARGAGEAGMLRALSAAYDIARDRAQATIAAPGFIRGNDDQVFSWHFTSVLGEFAFASHDSDRSLRNRAHDANLLVTHFVAWVDALEAGFVDMRHVLAMLKHSRVLDETHYADYGSTVLEYAQSHTPGQTAGFAERTASTIAAEAFEAAHERARAQRYVSINHDGHGMAILNAYLPSEVAAPIGQLLDKRAREHRELDTAAAEDHKAAVRAASTTGAAAPAEFVPDTRTIAQIRADIFAETLLCATPGASNVKANVSIVVPALTLLSGRVDGTSPALLDGMLPMSFSEARQFAGEATSFERVLTDPITGHATCVDTYLPNRALRRFLQVRDRTCRFPGCVRPAAVSDLDHTTPFSEGGETSTRNLGHLCKGHHVQKHEKPWTVTNLGGGVLQWQSPLGQVVVSEPEPLGPQFRPKDEGTAVGSPDTDLPGPGASAVAQPLASAPGVGPSADTTGRPSGLPVGDVADVAEGTEHYVGDESEFGVEQNSAIVSTDSEWPDEHDLPPHSDVPPPF
ncbi:MAG: DUF222 domain-containing protein [Gulosibacter sp.]|uniref:HNH endonuclease signature motif containing protein n=1 Tax=Gulosibacter sp. TaxID=2817531 RepID=UPI003F908F2B